MTAIRNLALICLLVLFSSAAAAQTPDGSPPSGENVCDPFAGDANAFGLCNAYCEAMDCDSPDVKASKRACERKFLQFIGATGEAPPCTDLSCPCNDAEDFPFFTSFLTGDPPTAIETCMSSETATTISVILNRLDGQSAEADSEVDGDGFCGSSLDGDPAGALLPTTPEEAEVCAILLLMAADDQNVDCTPL